MLLDLVIQSVNDFQDDCLKLCEKHYPAVHNQGMSEHHLGLAFSRRMEHTFRHFGYNSIVRPIEVLDAPDLPHHYRISSEIGTVWVLSHHMVSAGKSCRENLLSSTTEWQSEYGYALQPNDLLFLFAIIGSVAVKPAENCSIGGWANCRIKSTNIQSKASLFTPVNLSSLNPLILALVSALVTSNLATLCVVLTNSNWFESTCSCTPYYSGSIKLQQVDYQSIHTFV